MLYGLKKINEDGSSKMCYDPFKREVFSRKSIEEAASMISLYKEHDLCFHKKECKYIVVEVKRVPSDNPKHGPSVTMVVEV